MLILITAAPVSATTSLDWTRELEDLESPWYSPAHDPLLEFHFDVWLKRQAKSYETAQEYDRRRSIYHDTIRTVARHNAAYHAGHTTFAMTTRHSPFADLTNAEFATQYLMNPQDCSATTTTRTTKDRPSLSDIAQALHGKTIPPVQEEEEDPDLHVDWRTRGVVTPIKNQGNCGSCWTFSTTGCLEAHTCLAAQTRLQAAAADSTTAVSSSYASLATNCPTWSGLSEQQLVDCAGAYNNHGCEGGLPSQAYEYIKYNPQGLQSETAYPYHAAESASCQLSHKDDGTAAAAQVLEVYNITSQAEGDLEYAVTHIGPVSVAYQVTPDFRLYAHGVYDSFNATTATHTNCHDDSQSVNHAVVAVGLGTTDLDVRHNVTERVPYYIVRNSWGTQWGMEGYFWMKRGQNLCGISDCASFPLVPAAISSSNLKDNEAVTFRRRVRSNDENDHQTQENEE